MPRLRRDVPLDSMLAPALPESLGATVETIEGAADDLSLRLR
jgi:hypothetical protein